MTIDTTRPRLYISPPTLEKLPFGLLSVANEQTPSDEHAQLGVMFEPLSGVTGGTLAIAADGSQTGSLGAEDLVGEDNAAGAPNPGTFPTIYTNPFLVYAGVTGKPIGHTVEEFQARATAKLALNAPYWIERGLWTGASGGAHLAASGTAVLGGGSAVTVQQGLGLLEEWLGNNVGAVGVIHAPRKTGPALWNQVRQVGARTLTLLNTPVALGTGYSNTSPGDVAAATNVGWLYATGPVTVVRGETQLLTVPAGQKTSLAYNTTTVYATEIVSVGFESGVACVPVSL